MLSRVIMICSLVKPKFSDSMKAIRSSKRDDWPTDSQYFENEARKIAECGWSEVIGIAGMARLKVFATTDLAFDLLFDNLSSILNIL